MNRTRTPRPEWAAVDVGYFRNPKVAVLPAGLQLAHLQLILYTTEHLLDGRVPERLPPSVPVTDRQVAELEQAGLIVRVGPVRVLKDWDHWQKPRDAWVQEKQRRRDAASLANCQRWHEEWCRCLEGAAPVRKKNAKESSDV